MKKLVRLVEYLDTPKAHEIIRRIERGEKVPIRPTVEKLEGAAALKLAREYDQDTPD